MRGRPVRRAIFMTASLASVPELAKKTREPSSAPVSEIRRSASATCMGVAKRFETWPRVPSCALMAAVSVGCAWPRAFTAIPASRSR